MSEECCHTEGRMVEWMDCSITPWTVHDEEGNIFEGKSPSSSSFASIEKTRRGETPNLNVRTARMIRRLMSRYWIVNVSPSVGGNIGRNDVETRRNIYEIRQVISGCDTIVEWMNESRASRSRLSNNLSPVRMDKLKEKGMLQLRMDGSVQTAGKIPFQ